jgi:sulfur carrier protein
LKALIQIHINGDDRPVAAGSTLADLLAEAGIDPRMVVVEHNRRILRDRAAYGGVMLQEGDVLELVHFVGGG